MTQCTIDGRTLKLVQGDITEQEVDAIVNAANSRLAGGGGVDGAIHRRGGPTIMDETRSRYPDGCPTGSAVITGAGNLPARFVIHAVGPVWQGGHQDEAAMLQAAYRRCLELAAEHQCESIAFPSLSTGAYRYPMEQASRIAIDTMIDFLRDHPLPRLVYVVLFDAIALEVFDKVLQERARDLAL